MQLSSNGDSSRNTTNDYRRLQFLPIVTDRATILGDSESAEAAVTNLDDRLTLPTQNDFSVSPMSTCQQVSFQDRNESISSTSGTIVKSSQTPLYSQYRPNPVTVELSDALSKEDRYGRGRKSSNVSWIESFGHVESP
jgi:hypothetical protein